MLGYAEVRAVAVALEDELDQYTGEDEYAATLAALERFGVDFGAVAGVAREQTDSEGEMAAFTGGVLLGLALAEVYSLGRFPALTAEQLEAARAKTYRLRALRHVD